MRHQGDIHFDSNRTVLIVFFNEPLSTTLRIKVLRVIPSVMSNFSTLLDEREH